MLGTLARAEIELAIAARDQYSRYRVFVFNTVKNMLEGFTNVSKRRL